MTKPCHPDDCAITQRLDIKRSTKTEKKKLAEYYYTAPECKWTMERIAKALDVDKAQISRWLELLQTATTEPRTSKRGRKGEGRPKGSKKPQRRANPAAVQAAAALVIDQQMTLEQAAADTGAGSVQVVKTAVAEELGRREGAVETTAAASLSMTAKQKLEAAIRQRERKQDQEFDQRVLKEVERRMDTVVLPAWRETIEWAEAVRKREKGLLTAAQYKLVWTCLHPDRVQDEGLRKKFAEAFSIFEQLAKFLCGPEKEPPAKFPRTWREAQSSASERV